MESYLLSFVVMRGFRVIDILKSVLIVLFKIIQKLNERNLLGKSVEHFVKLSKSAFKLYHLI